MKSIVLDTNVLLDIFVFNDFRAIHLKQKLLDGQLDALACPKTLDEFADVIAFEGTESIEHPEEHHS